MAFKLAEAYVEFKQRGLKQVQTGATGLTSKMQGLAKSIGPVRAALATLGAGAFVGKAIAAAGEQIKSERKLAAVLKATGHAAGKSAAEIQKLASSRQAVTNFSDEATIAAAGVLATFKEIKGSVFDGAIIAAQDLSAVMGQDLDSSIVQIGKALNDPIKGVTALTRVGVSFTQQQKDQIKTMQESGDLMGAQGVILKELKGEFGGAAKAMADPFVQFKNTFGDVMENIGFAIRPIVKLFTDFFTRFLGPVTNNRIAMTKFGDAIANKIAPAIRDLADASIAFIAIFAEVSGVIFDVITVVPRAVSSLLGLETGLGSLIRSLGVFSRNWRDVFAMMTLDLVDFIEDAKQAINELIQKVINKANVIKAQATGGDVERVALEGRIASTKLNLQGVIADIKRENEIRALRNQIIANENPVAAGAGDAAGDAAGAGAGAGAGGGAGEDGAAAKAKGPQTFGFEALARKVQSATDSPVVGAIKAGNAILEQINQAANKPAGGFQALKGIVDSVKLKLGPRPDEEIAANRKEKREARAEFIHNKKDKIGSKIESINKGRDGRGIFGPIEMEGLGAQSRGITPQMKQAREIAAISLQKQGSSGALGKVEIEKIVKQLKATHDLLAKKGIKTDAPTAVLGE